MEFEWYTPNLTALQISINNGGITFYKDVIEAMKSPKYVIFGYNEEKKVLAVKTSEEETENSIAFISKKKNSYIRIYDKNLIMYIKSKIDNGFDDKKKTKKYLAKWDEEEETLYIYLEKAIQ